MGYVRALRVLHHAFGHYPAAHRVHILIRFLTCPFLRTLDEVPVGARVLDIGSGHGLYAYLVTLERAREVIAVDPDLRKNSLPSPSPKVRKVAGFDDCIRGTFDAVAMFDTAYRMSLDVRRAVFARAFERLRSGGTFVVKEMDPSQQLKMKWARFQERISDRFLGITAGEGFTTQTTGELEEMLREIGFVEFRARAIDRGYLHPHMIYTARKP